MNTNQINQIELCRRIHFSCGHRYDNPKWDESKNKEVFGLCYSKHGHGHNYILDAYFKGSINNQTGMIVNLKDVQNILEQVTQPLDHHFLNTDVEEFKVKVPTTENIALWCFDKINIRLQEQSLDSVKLSQVRLFEGDDLWVNVYA